MITIHDVDETILFYGSLGAERKETGNCTLFSFFDAASLSGFGEICMGFA